jgi:hypothetical protein
MLLGEILPANDRDLDRLAFELAQVQVVIETAPV